MKELQSYMHPSANNVEEYFLKIDYEHIISEAVARLSPQRRLVYEMSRLQGLNHEEIALHLQLSRNTVKNHLVEALRSIRNYLGQNGTVLLCLGAWMMS
jgi:RNA polymerase sigma-70 factor (ECF subfamily)